MIGVVTVRCRVACVVSVVVNNILSARVVLSSVVAVVAAVRRNELSQSDGAARQLRASLSHARWTSTVLSGAIGVEQSTPEGVEEARRLLKHHLAKDGPGADFSYVVL